MPNVQPKAIPTRFMGHLFRSRLEARWAVFFEALGIRWEYEKEGYELPSGRYLPDFWIPHIKSWIEIKGACPTDREEQLARELATQTATEVFIFHGSIKLPSPHEYPGATSAVKIWPEDGWDESHVWCECETCGLTGVQFDGRTDRLPCKECYQCGNRRHGHLAEGKCDRNGCAGRCPRSWHGDKGYAASTPRLILAYTAAISAQFEHGATGLPRPR